MASEENKRVIVVQAVGEKAMRVLSRYKSGDGKGDLYRLYKDACKQNADNPEIVLGTLMVRALEEPEFGKAVITAETNISEISAMTLTEEDVKQIRDLKRALEQLKDPVTRAVEKKIASLLDEEDALTKVASALGKKEEDEGAVLPEELPPEELKRLAEQFEAMAEMKEKSLNVHIERDEDIEELIEDEFGEDIGTVEEDFGDFEPVDEFGEGVEDGIELPDAEEEGGTDNDGNSGDGGESSRGDNDQED